MRLAPALLRCLAGLALAATAAAATPTDPPAEVLRSRLEGRGSTVRIGTEDVAVHADLGRFYAARGYALAWGANAPTMAEEVAAAEADGLDPEAYRIGWIRTLLAADLGDPQAAADLDLLLTDAFLTLGQHLLRGRVDPASLSEDWHPTRRRRDLAAALDAALASGDVAGALDGLRPRHAEYARLREALARYRALAGEVGDLPTILPASTIEPGAESVRVPLVRQRLALFGDYGGPEPPDSLRNLHDDALVAAVRRFQERHGLEPSGAVDQPTRHALNQRTDRWVRAIALNLERWRWLPDDLGARHVMVNLPAFQLRVVEGGAAALEMRVVIGLRSWQTPVFSDTMVSVVLNPTWGVPPSIAAAETIPLARRNGAEYLSSRGFNVYRRGERVDPASVDWAAARAGEFAFVQAAGAANPLGELKFTFPNPDDIYIHDTNQKRLFARPVRAFSHGCIRAEQPRALAELLLRDRDWTPERLAAGLARGRTETVPIAPTPVHLVYFTAWADADGAVAFYDDVYGHDAKLAAALGMEE